MGTRNLKITVPVLMVTFSTMSIAYAQSTKYQRPGKAEKKADAVVAESPKQKNGKDVTPAATESATAAPVNPTDKVDVTDLEQKYWAAKDSEFTVVQNRQYPKAKRVSLSVGYGPILNDTYADGNQLGVGANYYFTERTGVELMYSAASTKANTLTQSFIDRYATVPNHNLIKSYYGAAFNWIPFYAKMSVLDKKIIYFDMAISPGIGITNYQQQTRSGNGDQVGAFTLSLDITQHFFLSRTFAVRLDVRNRFYNESVKDYSTGASAASQQARSTTVLLGVQLFY